MTYLLKYAFRAGACLAAFLLAALSVSASFAQNLDAVRARGYLICAATEALSGFAQQSENGLWTGFDIDFCRAVAAAALGDPNLVEFRPMSGSARFAQLQTGEVDLMSRSAYWTLRRDSLYGVRFAGASFYDGQAIMVPSSRGNVSAFELDGVTICAMDQADELSVLDNFFFQNQTRFEEVIYESRYDLGVAYAAGLCDAVSAPSTWLNSIRRRLPDPTAHRILPERLTKEPLGPLVRGGDDEWYNIVRWTLFTLINAEELGVTSQNLDTMLEAKTPAVRRLLGLEADFGAAMRLDSKWMVAVIRAVGNYGEIYARNFGTQTRVPLRRGLNSLWTQGGLLFAPPVR